jgi:hypothetical protein
VLATTEDELGNRSFGSLDELTTAIDDALEQLLVL